MRRLSWGVNRYRRHSIYRWNRCPWRLYGCWSSGLRDQSWLLRRGLQYQSSFWLCSLTEFQNSSIGPDGPSGLWQGRSGLGLRLLLFLECLGSGFFFGTSGSSVALREGNLGTVVPFNGLRCPVVLIVINICPLGLLPVSIRL